MTITTEIRINHPVDAVALLDHVTRVAGGDPAIVRRREVHPGQPRYDWSDSPAVRHHVENCAAQGLTTWAGVSWGEDVCTGDLEDPRRRPPALVVLSIDNPYGWGTAEHSGRWHQANVILPEIVRFLDDAGVPRDRWWWEDESYGVWYHGTVDVRELANPERTIIDTWTPEEVTS